MDQERGAFKVLWQAAAELRQINQRAGCHKSVPEI